MLAARPDAFPGDPLAGLVRQGGAHVGLAAAVGRQGLLDVYKRQISDILSSPPSLHYITKSMLRAQTKKASFSAVEGITLVMGYPPKDALPTLNGPPRVWEN